MKTAKGKAWVNSVHCAKTLVIKFSCLRKKKPDISGKSGNWRHTGGYVLAASLNCPFHGCTLTRYYYIFHNSAKFIWQ